MMSINYGVCPKEASPRKGYSDFVQHTGPVMSGQLRLVLNYSQAFRVSLSAAQIGRNLLMGLDCAETEQLAKHGGSPSSEVPTKNVATCTPGIQWDGKHSFSVNQQVTGKEKGNAANVALWDDGFFHHEGNQKHTRFKDGCFFSHQENQYLAAPKDNYITLSDLVHRLQSSFGQSQNYTGISGEVNRLPDDNIGTQNHPEIIGEPERLSLSESVNYETFVGQSSGASLAFLRCSALSLRPQASSTQVEKFTLDPSSFSRSTLASISAVSSCGKRIPLYMVLLFMWFFAMLNLIECLNKGKITAKNGTMKLFKQNALTCLNTLSNLFKQSDFIRMKIAKPSSVSSTAWASNHNVTEAYTMAFQHSTQTRPKFVFLFLGTPNEFPNTTPTVLRVEADTEDEGRAKFVGWTLIFAAQIRTEAPYRLQVFSTDEGFMWVYEQRLNEGVGEEPLSAVGSRYMETSSGNLVVIKEVTPGRVVFSYDQHPKASDNYPLDAFLREFTRHEVSHA